MKITLYRKTPCPHCGGYGHRITSSKRRGVIRVRYHKCECGQVFVSRESATRVLVEPDK